jgi:hypothetical protein
MVELLVISIVFADFTLRLRIVDQSCMDGISVTVFADKTTLLPCVKSSGDVISLHNVMVQHKTLFNYVIVYFLEL